MSEDPFSDVTKRRETRLQAFRDFFSGKKSKPKLGTSNGKGLGTSNGKGLGSSGGLSYGSLEETRNRPDVEEVRLSPVHEHVVDADNIVGEAEFYQARPFSGKKGQRVAGEFMPYREEHEPYGLRDDGIVCISTAYLYEIHPTNDTLIRHALAPLEIGVGGEGVVYSMYKTDDHGKVKVEEPEEEGGEPPPAYTLMFGEKLPDNTDYVLPDETGSGSDGEYYTPICYIKKGKLEAKQFQDGRQAQVRGSLEGHRGPLWWIAGYDAVRNVGVGQNVYMNYTESDDFKNLRRLSEKGQERNCDDNNKVSGLPQVKVNTSGNTINIHGNRFNKTWKVGDKKQAIIEDGLVRCLTDIQADTFTSVKVFAHSTSQPTITEVAKVPVPNQKGNAYAGGSLNNTMWAGGSTAADNVVVSVTTQVDFIRGVPNTSMVFGNVNNTMWAGGASTAGNVVVGAVEGHDYVRGLTSTINSDMIQGTPRASMWAGGDSTADNIVVSASVANDYVRAGTVNSQMIQGTPRSPMWVGGVTTADNVVVSASVANDYVRGGTVNSQMIKGAPHATMWAGGASTPDNVVVSVSEANDYVRAGTENVNMIQGTPHTTMWAGGTKMTLPWVKICVTSCSCSSSGSSESGTTQCYWVLGDTTEEESSAPADYKFVHDPTQVTGVTDVVQVTGVVNATTIGVGIESRTLGQGIVGTNITQVTGVASVVQVTGVTDVTTTTGAGVESRVLGQAIVESESSPLVNVTGVASVVQVTGVVNATTTGAGVESRVLGQGIVGANITQVTGVENAVRITGVTNVTTTSTGSAVASVVFGQGIVGANITQVTGIDDVVHVTGVSEVLESNGVEDVVYGQGIVGSNITPVTGIASTSSSPLVYVPVIKELTGVTVVNATTTVDVLKANNPNERILVESTGDGCSSCPEE